MKWNKVTFQFIRIKTLLLANIEINVMYALCSTYTYTYSFMSFFEFLEVPYVFLLTLTQKTLEKQAKL